MRKVLNRKVTTAIIVLGALIIVILGILYFTPTHAVISHALIEEQSVDKLMETSSLITEGKFIKKTKPFAVEGMKGEFQVYTDYFFQPESILRGEDESNTLTVRMRGGRYDDIEYIDENSTVFEFGEKYLLFLRKVTIGGGTNTEGDYYYINGSYQGVYNEIKPEELMSGNSDIRLASDETYYANTKYLSYYFEALKNSEEAGSKANEGGQEKRSFALNKFEEAATEVENGKGYSSELIATSAIEERLKKVNSDVPVNLNLSTEVLLENLKANLESGFINQKEYDYAIANLDNYGKIVSPYEIDE